MTRPDIVPRSIPAKIRQNGYGAGDLLVDHRKSWRADGGGPLSAPWIDLSGISTQRSIVLKTTKGVVNATCVGLERQFHESRLGFCVVSCLRFARRCLKV